MKDKALIIGIVVAAAALIAFVVLKGGRSRNVSSASLSSSSLDPDVKAYIDSQLEKIAVGTCADVPKLVEQIRDMQLGLVECAQTKVIVRNALQDVKKLREARQQAGADPDTHLAKARERELSALKRELVPACAVEGKVAKGRAGK